MVQKLTILVGAALFAFLGFAIFKFYGNDFDLPKPINTENGEIVLNNTEGKVAEKLNMEEDKKANNRLVRKIAITDGVRHSIPLDEILSGGPPKDGIPSIDKPKFISIRDADEWLKEENELGLALQIDGVKRFYPYRILVGHEIVNDIINGKRVLITYCPLCFTGIVFDPLIHVFSKTSAREQSERVEFGVSGKLWNSNLLMYDRKTDTLWS